jgi:MazG family protein
LNVRRTPLGRTSAQLVVVMVRSFESPRASALDQQTGETFRSVVDLMQRLLAPDGCPWDREQDERTLRKYVLEEAAEVVDAIDAGDDVSLCEELGDLSLQVAFLSEIARRRGAFGPDDVFQSICEKLVRRHPHVFGDVGVSSSDEVVDNWEAIKRAEKPARRRGVLGNAPRNLAALTRASDFSRRAAKVGFDWPNALGAREKVNEELQELDVALAENNQAHINEEFGDLLFALVNWARHVGVEPESALRDAADKFQRRFEHVEDAVLERGGWPKGPDGKPTPGIPLAELDELWTKAKLATKASET